MTATGSPRGADTATRALAGASDELIAAAVEHATLGALLPALAHVTGDLDLVPPHLRPDPDDFMDPQGGLAPDALDEASALAASTLRDLRDGTRHRVDDPPTDDAPLRPLAAHIVGDANVDAYLALLLEELAPEGVDRRAPTWHAADLAPDRTFRVAIVGAGMSGLLAAHRLTQVGVEVTVFEKNTDVGGTWFDNTYPGCRVDVPNHLYSYSFAPARWPQHFSDQATLLDYFRGFADDTGVRAAVRFGTEVVGADWSDDTHTWTVRIRTADGGAGDGDGADPASNVDEAVVVDAVVSAVGQLNRPRLPDIPGIDEFAGPWFHSARWRHDVDLTGKRVAVIGTGASAAQFIPEVADQAADLVVFQRTPNWLAPTPDYHDEVGPESRWLLEALPEYGDWYRLWLFWRMHEGLTAAAKVDPEWSSPTGSVSLLNEMVRLGLVAYLEEQFAGHPDLLEHVVPHYPPIAKRIVRDNGIWARTLTRDNVHLVTDPIEAVTADGVRAGGADHDVDVIIYGTGFSASQFLTPMRVTGREGRDLHEQWAGDARAYLGITVPHFPNLFCLYGPNTNIVVNGSIIFFSECEVRYLTECIHRLLADGHRALDVRPEVHDAFNERVDAANRQMAWGASAVSSWYKNARGRVTQNWPFPLLEYWQLTQAPDPDDYRFG